MYCVWLWFPPQDQKERVYSTVRSRSTSVTVGNLQPGTVYVFQVRAFTAAGYGTYGPRVEITTKEEASGGKAPYRTVSPSQTARGGT